MDSIIKETLKDLKIGESRIEFEGDRIESNNIQSGNSSSPLWKRNQAKGSIIFVHDELWFFLNQLQFSYTKQSQDDISEIDSIEHSNLSISYPRVEMKIRSRTLQYSR